MKNYSIPSLGLIVGLPRLPDIRFVVGKTGRYRLSQDISNAPMVEYAPSLIARAELLLPATAVAFAREGVDGVYRVEAEQNEAAEAYTAWLEAKSAPEPEPEPAPVRRGRGRPRAAPEPEPEVDEDEVVEDDVEVDEDAPPAPSSLDAFQLIAIDVVEATTSEAQWLPLLDCPPIVARMASSTKADQVIRNNYASMISVANNYAAALDRLQQAEPHNSIPEFALPGVTANLEELEPDVRRAASAGMQTHVGKLRNVVAQNEASYNRLVNWFTDLLQNTSAIEFVPLNEEKVEFNGIEVSQLSVIKDFFSNEFVEVS